MSLQRFLLTLCCFYLHIGYSQSTTDKPLKIAVIAPLYIDSAFNNYQYKLGNANLPKQAIPGLDFYNGIMTAIDSLNKENTSLSVTVYDSKSVSLPLQKLITLPALNEMSLIITSFNTRAEIKPLADFALAANIPLLSYTYPNDGSVENNPFFFLVNPTLKTHIEAIYRYLHKNYPTDNMVLFRKKGPIEDLIQQVLTEMNKKTAGLTLKLKTYDLPDSFSTSQVTDILDSTKQNIVICGTLNEEFAMNLTRALGSAKNYHNLVIGMPTWDGLKDISRYNEIIYTTPYNFLRNEKLTTDLTNKYKTKLFGRPSDMYFKGFEAMFHFGKLLLKHRGGLVNNLSDKDFKLFNEFDFQPVKTATGKSIPDYLENKKLYFIRKLDGLVKSVN
jgi:hypothetical protein